MKFLIVTHVKHKRYNGQIYAYAPYVREMNLWLKHVDEVRVVAPVVDEAPDAIDIAYDHSKLSFYEVPSFNILGWKNRLVALCKLPYIVFQTLRAMVWAEHIHLRCPGNMGLLGVMLQRFFPNKPKTAKYAGNWDPNSKQPWSYRLQRKWLSDTSFCRNMKVLVYGEWSDQTTNVLPFFTATYRENEKEEESLVLRLKYESSNRSSPVRLLFVGTLSANKRPMLSVRAAHQLREEGISVTLDIYGDGDDRAEIEAYIRKHHLNRVVTLHGNQDAQTLKEAYKRSDFLLFASRSEGWPKVVAEAMWWGCIPITTNVSCVGFMVGYGERGKVIEPNVEEMAETVRYYLENRKLLHRSRHSAMHWSRLYTLESFERAIVEVLHEK